MSLDEKFMMSDAEIRKYQKRARYVANKKGYSQLADDFAQEIFVEFLESPNRGATVDQLFIDYLRKQYGRTGIPGGDARSFAIRTAQDLSAARHIAADPGEQPENRRIDHLFGVKQAYLYQAYFIEQRSEASIGQDMGITESRVCQLIKPIKKKIQDEYIRTTGMERMEWDESFLSFKIDWVVL